MTNELLVATIVDLDEVRREREERRDIVIALDDALYAFVPPHDLRRWRRRDRHVRYVPLSALTPDARPDLTVGPYVPSVPGGRLLAQTLERVYEIDTQARVYRDGEILWAEPLTAIGAPRSWLPGQLRVGEEMALLFTSREDDGWHFRVHVSTDPVVIYGALPARRRGALVPRDWLSAALQALPDRSSETTALEVTR